MISLKQAPIPDYVKAEFEAYEWQKVPETQTEEVNEVLQLDGAKLYQKHCRVCHQKEGQGIEGAFPSLAGSEYANLENPESMIRTVLFGLDRDNEYGAMLPFEEILSDEDIAAILTFERTSWGNQGTPVNPEQVRDLRKEGKPSNWPL